MSDIAVIILAAGMGKRMRSDLPKVLHPVLRRPMLCFVIEAVMEISPSRVIAVVGHQAEKIKASINSAEIEYALQAQQLGTGHAALCAFEHLRDFHGDVIILNGDFPLITSGTLRELIESHRQHGAAVSLISADFENPSGYGRVIRKSDGGVLGIVEQRDATADELAVREINSGAYCVRSDFLWRALQSIGTNNDQKEYYLTDIVKVAAQRGERVLAHRASDAVEVQGVNSREELALVEAEMRKRVNKRLMLMGVSIIDPAATYISPEASIGADTVIYPNTYIYGRTSIGRGCSVGPSAWIEDSEIGDEVSVNFSCFIVKTVIEDRVSVGPFAHLRPEAKLLSGAKIGNFVEIKKSTIGRGSKVPHLSYVGDATLGERVNIGAGTITCNYDGVNKHQTLIGDDVFIGSDTMLVAPLKVGSGSTTAAGSTITKDVPAGSLAIGRAKQVVIEGWKRKAHKKEGA
ncbi:MAG: bifunctional UDP-N-acetylglucosamine diphosphorylase/glucosamine-1-phosphate N-acetyltransferase GlmU [Deltaproteobacteria bacterium]